ncbi:MAG: hypothetical protein ACTH2P_05920 [Oceanisphaera sp.]
MLEDNNRLSINIGVIDFTLSLPLKIERACVFLPEDLIEAVNFSDLLMVIEPPTDWLLQHQAQLSEIFSCVIISKKDEASSKLKTIQLPQSVPYTHCVLDLTDAFNQPSLVGVDLGDFCTIISQGNRLHYYQSSWLTSKTLDSSNLSSHLKELDALSNIKGLFTVAALSQQHSHDIDAYIDIASFVRNKGNENTITACAVRFTPDEPASRASVIAVVLETR